LHFLFSPIYFVFSSFCDQPRIEIIAQSRLQLFHPRAEANALSKAVACRAATCPSQQLHPVRFWSRNVEKLSKAGICAA